MRKKIIWLCLSAAFIFTFSACVSKSVSGGGSEGASSVPAVQSSDGPLSRLEVEGSPEKSERPKPQKRRIRERYPITGESDKIVLRARDEMHKWRKAIVELADANKEDMFINGSSDRRAVALTFDDGPDNVVTPGILEVLKANNVQASFFFIGNRLLSYPDVVKRVDRDGNLVLSHSFDHPMLSRKTPAEIDRELSQTEDKIFSLIGKRPAIMRPPYGDVLQPTINEITRNGYKIVIWSIDTLDWSQREKQNIIKNIFDNIKPGDIILMHSNGDKNATLEALPEIIKKLKAMDYEILTLDKMLDIKAYK